MVSRPTYLGGLGFGLKWNMGWMHDVLRFFSRDPVHRRFHQRELTFGLMYAWSENFVLPLSHDEVVHLKGSLHRKMPGDDWQKFANLRALYAYMYAHPGKKLLFMGGELGQTREWNHDASLDWHLLREGPYHAGLQQLVRDLNRVLRAEPALHQRDFEPAGFEWIDLTDADHSTLSFLRRARDPDDVVIAVCNFTPVPAHGLPGRRPVPRLLPRADQHGRPRVRRQRSRQPRRRPRRANAVARPPRVNPSRSPPTRRGLSEALVMRQAA